MTADFNGAVVVGWIVTPMKFASLSKVEAITQRDLDDIQRKARVEVT